MNILNQHIQFYALTKKLSKNYLFIKIATYKTNSINQKTLLNA